MLKAQLLYVCIAQSVVSSGSGGSGIGWIGLICMLRTVLYIVSWIALPCYLPASASVTVSRLPRQLTMYRDAVVIKQG